LAQQLRLLSLLASHGKRGGLLSDSDQQLVDAIKQGDTSAFDELYQSFFQRIYNFSARRLGDPAEAEDITQDVFTAVFTCIDRFEGKSDLIVWVYGITRNILNNRLRRRGGVRLVSLDDIPEEAAPLDLSPESRAEARELLERVQEAIEALPREQRRILELRHTQRLAVRRIAEIVNRSEDAVKSSLYRTRRALSAQLPDASTSPSF
jgi:RNA polymerase sigma-70 factor (ECF subfamily)